MSYYIDGEMKFTKYFTPKHPIWLFANLEIKFT